MRIANAFLLLLSSFLLVACETTPAKKSENDATVAEVITAIRRACGEAKADLNSDVALKDFPLSGVSVTVQTKLTESVSSGFDLVVVSAKGQFDRSATQALTLKLDPHPIAFSTLVAGEDIYKEVKAAIKAAAVAAVAARDAAGTDFRLKTITASIGFDVTKSGSAGVKINVGAVTIGPSLSAGVTGSQKIDLTFGKEK